MKKDWHLLYQQLVDVQQGRWFAYNICIYNYTYFTLENLPAAPMCRQSFMLYLPLCIYNNVECYKVLSTTANIPTRIEQEQPLPVTSYMCQWKVPKSRKESTIPMSEAVFQKYEYSKQRKQPVEDFDPRPPEFRGTSSDRLPALLEEIRGKQLCVYIVTL